jgi:hypothetical protein
VYLHGLVPICTNLTSYCTNLSILQLVGLIHTHLPSYCSKLSILQLVGLIRTHLTSCCMVGAIYSKINSIFLVNFNGDGGPISLYACYAWWAGPIYPICDLFPAHILPAFQIERLLPWVVAVFKISFLTIFLGTETLTTHAHSSLWSHTYSTSKNVFEDWASKSLCWRERRPNYNLLHLQYIIMFGATILFLYNHKSLFHIESIYLLLLTNSFVSLIVGWNYVESWTACQKKWTEYMWMQAKKAVYPMIAKHAPPHSSSMMIRLIDFHRAHISFLAFGCLAAHLFGYVS